jgi:hypothetical protein
MSIILPVMGRLAAVVVSDVGWHVEWLIGLSATMKL